MDLGYSKRIRDRGSGSGYCSGYDEWGYGKRRVTNLCGRDRSHLDWTLRSTDSRSEGPSEETVQSITVHVYECVCVCCGGLVRERESVFIQRVYPSRVNRYPSNFCFWYMILRWVLV